MVFEMSILAGGSGPTSTDCATSMLMQTLDSKYRGGEDYYDEEDGEGADAIDSFLKNLPEILVSVIIIMIAYFVWTFFNSPTGSALGNAVGELVGMLTDMMRKWQFFLLAYAVIALLPAAGRGLAYLVDRFDKRATSNALKKYNKMQNDSQMALERSKIQADLNKTYSNAYIDFVKQNYDASQADRMIRTVLNHRYFVEDPDNPGEFQYNPLSESVPEDLDRTLKKVRQGEFVATVRGYEAQGDFGKFSKAVIERTADDMRIMERQQDTSVAKEVYDKSPRFQAGFEISQSVLKMADETGITDFRKIYKVHYALTEQMGPDGKLKSDDSGLSNEDIQRKQALKLWFRLQDADLDSPAKVTSQYAKQKVK